MGELIAILRRALSLVVCQSYLFASSVCRLLQQTNAEEWICFQHMQTAIADECWCNKLRQFYFVLALHDTLDDVVASFLLGEAGSSVTAITQKVLSCCNKTGNVLFGWLGSVRTICEIGY